jgi:hypothetical protein
MKLKLYTVCIFIVCFFSSFGEERFFPIYGKEARERGYVLPKPYGINLIYVDMDQEVDIERLELLGIGNLVVKEFKPFTENKAALTELIKQKFIADGNKEWLAKIMANAAINTVENTVIDIDKNFANGNIKVEGKKAKTKNTTRTIRGDVWVFPFLNVYGLVGETKGKSIAPITVAVNGLTLDVFGKEINIPIPSQKIEGGNFILNYKGLTYGAGMTLVGGYKNFFALTDINYTYTSLDIVEGNVGALVISPKIGYHTILLKRPISFWVGAMYQEITQTLKGNIKDVFVLPGIEIPGKFNVEEKATYPWNYSLGLRYEVTPSLEAIVEYGFGHRKYATFAVGYRF